MITPRMIGHGQYARRVTPVQLEGVTLYRDDAGTLHRECGRCGGRGQIAEYGHVFAGVCYECNYAGVRKAYATEDEALKSIRKAVRAAARRQAKADAITAVAIAARVSPEAIDRAHDAALRTQAQLEVKASKAQASRYAGNVGDRVTVTGIVAVAMNVEGSDFRTGRPVTNRFVIVTTDDGVTLKLSGSAAVLYEVSRNETVTMTATVKAHQLGRDGEAVTTAMRPKLG